MNFRVALLQIAAFGNDQNRNLAKGRKFCPDAKALGADLAAFPELWNIGCMRCRSIRLEGDCGHFLRI